MKNLAQSLFYEIILFASERPTFVEKSTYQAKWLLISVPFGIFFDEINYWFDSHASFVVFMMIALFINMIAGAWRHFKFNTFSLGMLIKKNLELFFILIFTYACLHTLDRIAGETFTGEYFQIVIQLSTILFPVSKVLKNIYLISSGRFPPYFIMDRIYKFKKTGNPNELLKTDKNEDD